MELNVHDLLNIRGLEAFQEGAPFPDWAKKSILQTPWVVVRRGRLLCGRFPVGIRGKGRGLRFAAWVHPNDIIQIVAPSDLVDPARWKTYYPASQPPPLKSMLSIKTLMHDKGVRWGPVGSLGFELATGAPTLDTDSDLDLVIDAPVPIAVEAARSLLLEMETLSCVRLDVQMLTPTGGVALKEYCIKENVMVKTALAPVLRKRHTLWE